MSKQRVKYMPKKPNLTVKETYHENLSTVAKTITKSWEEIRHKRSMYIEEIGETFFHINTSWRNLFAVAKLGHEPTEADVNRRCFKHSVAVMNCLEVLVQFVNGNEESKPLLFVLGKKHKGASANEKMFLNMKDAICTVIKNNLNLESARAWGFVLQYIFINYVFQGMQMIEAI